MATDLDVVVIGAGFSGLYAAHKFRDELGLSVQGFETAGGVGGTWWWNRYPGARCDFESVHYSYSFSEELQREWEWSEKFAAQPEILSYLDWVADRLDVRRVFKFDTRVDSLDWNEESSRWTVRTSDGQVSRARYVVSCVGGLSKPKEVEFPGAELFEGELYWTSSWPHHEVDLRGKRVAVVGTGSTGIQVIQEIADQVGHLTVMQRTPNFMAQLGNEPVPPELRRWNAENFDQVRADSRDRLIGAPYDRATTSALAVSEDERRAIYDKYYEMGGFSLLVSTFNDLLFDERANETLADYLREKIREQVKDPATAERLLPWDHPYGTKRPPFGKNYYQVFNQPNVELVDVKAAPIQEITATGIRTTDALYEFEVIILATGFDAFTGASLAIPTTGRDGVTLKQKWSDGPTNYLGLQIAGFPNLFTVIGPLSAASQYNTPLLIEDHVDFIADAVSHARARDAKVIDVSREAEQVWGRLVSDVLNMSLFSKSPNSWHMGANIVGKPQAAYTFPVGAPLYRAICAEVQHSGFPGFTFDDGPSRLPSLVRLDPGAALVLAGMMNQGAPPIEECTIDEMRGLVESLVTLQLPGPDMRTHDVDDPRLRIYLPDGVGSATEESVPVVLAFHGGGFAAGSIESIDPTCRRYAAATGAIVVSATYALAPEHPFPAAPEDAFAALQWTRRHIGEYGGDPRRIVLLGESAGANLAAVTAIRARDEDVTIAGQVLLYPTIDPDLDTPSRREFAAGPFLSAAAGERFWRTYLNGAPVTAQAAPIRADSLAGLAPALVVTLEIDITRDEAETYARAIAAEGVDVQQVRFDGLFHGAFNMSLLIPRVQEIESTIFDFIERHAGSSAEEPLTAGAGR